MVKKSNKEVFLYIEGGGDQAELRAELRRAFSEFFRKTELKGHCLKTVAGGGRGRTYDLYQTGVGQGKSCVLLVDSEDLVDEKCRSAWDHFKNREGDKQWKKPDGATKSDAHMMVCCMESWFLADREALKQYFDPGFNEAKLPHATNLIESISKEKVFEALKKATKESKGKREYDKGKHSFDLMKRIDPTKVEKSSPWAKKLIDTLCELFGIKRKRKK